MDGNQEGSASPFPPYYSPGSFTWATPLVATPSLLFAVAALFGVGRYIVSRSYPLDAAVVTVPRRLSPLAKLITALTFIVLLSFVVDGAVIVTRALIDSFWTSTVLAYYIGVSWLAWATNLASLMTETLKTGQWTSGQYAFWMVAAFGETLVGWLWAVGILRPEPGTIFSSYDYVLFSVFITRYILELSIAALCIVHMFTNRSSNETAPLLSAARSAYGATQPPSEAANTQPTQKEPSAFVNVIDKMRKLFPYIWPNNSAKLQFLVLACFVLMLLGLVVNAYTPQMIGNIVDSLNQDSSKFLWGAVLGYVGLRFLQGGSGLLQALQNWLWIPIGQYTTREVSVKLFGHLHSLSLHFHINRKTGEVLRVMDRGTNSIVQLLSQILFQVFPALANIVVAVFVFAFKFSPAFGLIVFVTMSLYLYVTIALTEWRTKYRRMMIELDNSARTKAVDSLLNFETVKYYNAENFEVGRYRDAIVEYQKADWKSSSSLNVLNLAQNSVISGGLLAGCLLFAWEVSQGRLTAGNFVTFNMYMMQLYTPLHFFGTYYRMIQTNFIDMEKMIALLEEEQTVQDAPDAKDLIVNQGEVVFDNVSFSYDSRQTALNGISFTIPKGKTVALVGPSGGGKSTIMRLLFRFYDPASGHIYIDGQDIKQVRQSSLRQNIGVVPQDTVLFNDTILYNIRYGNMKAPEDAVFKAAKAAQIHDKILTFPDGYETKVGERGLRLSGGEKQRVAIARTILKNPSIILLDEATSALDTTTERHIQQALSAVTQDRTTLVIAHRLSTIVNADKILVIKDGRVVEEGSHETLIRKGANGIYYEMWQKQLHEENEELTTDQDTVDGSDTNGSDLKATATPAPIDTKTTRPNEDTPQLVSSPTELNPTPQQPPANTNTTEQSNEDAEDQEEENNQGEGEADNADTTKAGAKSPSKKRKKKRSKSKKTTF